MQEAFLRRLVATTKCGICGHRYHADKISVLGHQDELWFLSVLCTSCHTQGLIAALVKEEGPPAITDLTSKEKVSFATADPVVMDDVLDIHNLLKEFQGDLSQLLSQECLPQGPDA